MNMTWPAFLTTRRSRFRYAGPPSRWTVGTVVGDAQSERAVERHDHLDRGHPVSVPKRHSVIAGDDYGAAHVAPRARDLLSRFDARCQHFERVIEDEPRGSW